MDLARFLPYRIAVLADAVSRDLAQVYTERYGLTRDEWRVLAVLADAGTVRTAHVIAAATLDKMPVSRAVARMAEAGWVERLPDPDDGRGALLRLTSAGRALHAELVPVVLAREALLLEALSASEQQVLDRALTALLARARTLSRALPVAAAPAKPARRRRQPR